VQEKDGRSLCIVESPQCKPFQRETLKLVIEKKSPTVTKTPLTRPLPNFKRMKMRFFFKKNFSCTHQFSLFLLTFHFWNSDIFIYHKSEINSIKGYSISEMFRLVFDDSKKMRTEISTSTICFSLDSGPSKGTC
jgi:hypothetical protein